MSDGRARIIEAAFGLFLERGFEGTSMNDLVRACGLSKGALYHHFADKDALHDATIDYFFTRFFPSETPDCGSESAAQVLSGMGESLIAVIAAVGAVTPDTAAYYRFVLAILPKVRQPAAGQLEEAQARLARAIHRGQDRGEISVAVPADALARQCIAAVEGTAFLCAVTGEGDVAARLRSAIRDLILLLQRSG